MKSLAFTIVALAAAAGDALASDPAALVAAKRSLQAAVSAAEVPALLEARGKFMALAAAERDEAAPRYWVAVADWRVVPFLARGPEGKEKAERHCKEGLRYAEEALRLAPGWGEALALKGALQGLSIQFLNPLAMMTVGPQIEESMSQALAAAPENPRVRFLEALNTLHKPAFVGGGPARAEEKFQKAIALYAVETAADSTAPDWGGDDAWLWAGRTAMKQQDPRTALERYRKALEANPANAWVKHALIPEAEKALREKEGS